MIKCNQVWKFGDDITTDVIFPGRYTYKMMEDEEMGQFAMIDDPSGFNKKAAPGDVIIGGRNWGCGSSREQAVKALKARKISAIIAKGFARIFYRNALNEGLLTIVCNEAADAIQEKDEVSIDLEGARILTSRGEFPFPPYPDFVQGLVASGGLVPSVIARLKKEGRVS